MTFSYLFEIAGVKLSFSTNNAEFASFVKGTLQNYQVSENIIPNEIETAPIEVNVVFDEAPIIKFSKFKIGNGITHDEKESSICFKHEFFNGKFRLVQNQLNIRGEVNLSFNKKLQYLIKEKLIKGYSIQSMIFHQLYRELILMPVFWRLRNIDGLYLLHASAVSDENETFVFVGNDGVGKTTIALKLLEKEGFTFFGDNFLLYDGEKIHPFVDTLRVNKKDTVQLKKFDASKEFTRVFDEGDRVHYNFTKKKIAVPKKPTHFFILKQSENNFQKEIGTSELRNLSFGINDYVKEFDKYSYANNLYFLFDIKKDVYLEELRAFTDISKNTEINILNLTRGANLFKIIKK